MHSGEIESGNARKEGSARAGWFLGHFIETDHPLRSTADVEVKWGTHAAGESRNEWASNATATTISVLIRGRFRLRFPDREILLEAEGDYALWAPGVPHTWSAEEETVILTVRWPSMPGDSKP